MGCGDRQWVFRLASSFSTASNLIAHRANLPFVDCMPRLNLREYSNSTRLKRSMLRIRQRCIFSKGRCYLRPVGTKSYFSEIYIEIKSVLKQILKIHSKFDWYKRMTTILRNIQNWMVKNPELEILITTNSNSNIL